jgi:hypothetical protein
MRCRTVNQSELSSIVVVRGMYASTAGEELSRETARSVERKDPLREQLVFG